MIAYFRYSTLIVAIVLSSLFLATGDVARSAAVEQGSGSSFRASHIVMFEADADPDQLLAELESDYGVSVGFIYRHAINGASLLIPSGREDDVRAHPGVTHLETNGTVEFQAFPEDQEVPTGLRRSGVDEQNALFDIDGGGPDTDVDIAIVDTGVDSTHPDLNVFKATDCLEDGTACEDVDLTSGPSTDELGHGTRSAGVAAARDNGFGVVGTAPGARIWSVKLDVPGANNNLAALIAGVDWITSHADEIDVASMSLISSGANSAILRLSIQSSVNAGVVYYVAAGNRQPPNPTARDVYGEDGVLGGGDDVEPASYPEVATISGYVDTDGLPGGSGATYFGEPDDTWVSFSNFSTNSDASNPVTSPGMAIDFMMPATDVMSTCIVTAFFSCDTEDATFGNYSPSDGTSIATPQAAGLAALLIARNSTRDFNGDLVVNQDDVILIRQSLIDMAIPQDDPVFGLVQPSGDPDGFLDPLGSARMVLDFDVSQFTLPDIGSVQPVSVSTPFIPIGDSAAPPDAGLAPVNSVQVTIVHDDSLTTIQNVDCGAVYVGANVVPPVRTMADTATTIGCFTSDEPLANNGVVLTFDIVRTGNGGADISLVTGGPFGTGFLRGGGQVPSAPLGSFRVFGATVTGSFALQGVSGAGSEAALANIDPFPTAIPASGPATSEAIGQYDPATGTFSIPVNAAGDYGVKASATNYIPSLFQFVTIVDDDSSVPVPTPTTLRGGDVDGDGTVNGGDVSTLIPLIVNATLSGDINGDTFLTAADLSIVISNFGLAPAGGVEPWAAP